MFKQIRYFASHPAQFGFALFVATLYGTNVHLLDALFVDFLKAFMKSTAKTIEECPLENFWFYNIMNIVIKIPNGGYI